MTRNITPASLTTNEFLFLTTLGMEFGLSSIEAASQVSVRFPQSEFAELIGAPVSSELINALSEADTADFWARLLLVVPESQAKASFALFAASALTGGSYLRDIDRCLLRVHELRRSG